MKRLRRFPVWTAIVLASCLMGGVQFGPATLTRSPWIEGESMESATNPVQRGRAALERSLRRHFPLATVEVVDSGFSRTTKLKVTLNHEVSEEYLENIKIWSRRYFADIVTGPVKVVAVSRARTLDSYAGHLVGLLILAFGALTLNKKLRLTSSKKEEPQTSPEQENVVPVSLNRETVLREQIKRLVQKIKILEARCESLEEECKGLDRLWQESLETVSHLKRKVELLTLSQITATRTKAKKVKARARIEDSADAPVLPAFSEPEDVLNLVKNLIAAHGARKHTINAPHKPRRSRVSDRPDNSATQ